MSQVPPPAAPMNYSSPGPQKSQGLAIGALICGILSIVLFCFQIIAIPLALVAIILGIIGMGKAKRGEATGEGMAKTGMILGIVGIALSILITILAFAGMSFLEKKGGQWQQQIEQKAKEMEQAANEAAAEAERSATTAPAVP